MTSANPRVGVSACLLGQRVRFDGEHKRQDWIAESLASHATVVAVCPEVSLGLGTPRAALRLIDGESGVRLVESRSGVDLTARATAHFSELAALTADLDGFIFKKSSPSCGLERVKVYSTGGMPRPTGVGLFARAVIDAAKALPVPLVLIEEGRLCDPAQRENFVLRVFARHALRQLGAPGAAPGRVSMSALQAFHRSYKLVLLEHAPAIYARLGAIVGNQARLTADRVIASYAPLFMSALAELPTVKTRVNALEHALGHLRGRAQARERAQIAEAIADYHKGELPFIAPLGLLYHEVRKCGVSYLLEQKLFFPFPRALGALTRL